MKAGKLRTMSICLSDIPKERITKYEKNGKLYLNLQTFDYDQPDQYGNDFSVSITPNKAEQEAKKNGEKILRVFLGNGKIWEEQGMRELTKKEVEQIEDDLPF